MIYEDFQSSKGSLIYDKKEPRKFDNSFGKQSALNDNHSHVDELINWAKDLPDDVEVSGGQSFYNKMTN